MTGSVQSVVARRSIGWPILMWCVFLAALAGRLFADMDRSPDFTPYVNSADGLMSMDFSDLVPFETFSRGLLLLFSNLFGNAYDGVVALHWLNTLFFVWGFMVLTRLRRENWQGALIICVAYGVLLCFITLRAMPAYLLASYAVLVQERRPKLSVSLILIAAGFHVSALLALPALVIDQCAQRFSSKFYERLSWLLFLCGLGSYLAVLAGLNFSSALSAFFGGYDDLTKFVTYAEDQNAASLSHRIYFGMVTVLTILFLFGNTERMGRAKVFVSVSYAIYSLASISPVVAYRQSLYFVMPLALLYPWGDWIKGPIKVMLFSIISAVVCFFSFDSIFY